ncbi:nuclear transport factor 2 family protein [Streptomyces sp. NY05-11A]|uniref:nuclear transport factor 2 family protein n=1 Tax=Streptomyces soliscabiei TaxID=588897 RepID=UPI0029BD8A5C|nr:hypothetical protein [Streptomyces sp. NY05-11A]MDX2677580.1 hypothetical protein [Streptomyces sp. NY05-11A]
MPFPFPGLPERCDDTADPEVIVVEQIATGTPATTGAPFRIPGLLVMRMRDGVIVHVRDYVDGLAAVRGADWNSAL